MKIQGYKPRERKWPSRSRYAFHGYSSLQILTNIYLAVPVKEEPIVESKFYEGRRFSSFGLPTLDYETPGTSLESARQTNRPKTLLQVETIVQLRNVFFSVNPLRL